MRTRILLLSLLLTCATVARAETLRSWDFRNSNVPFRAEAFQLTEARPMPEGLELRTNQDGFLLWKPHPLDGPVDVVTLRIKNSHPTEAAWMWESPKGLHQAFFAIPASAFMQDIDVSVASYNSWEWETPAVGIGLPKGADILIERITFRRWSAPERLGEAWKTFWTFDEYRPYSINFLWGPLLTFNPVARQNLFDTLPPPSWSGMRVIYAFILLSAVLALAVRFVSADGARGQKIGAAIIGGSVMFSWLLLDLRMGLELLNYAKQDLNSYVFAAEEKRIFRTHEHLYTHIERILPVVREHGRYVLLIDADSPKFANLRYQTYPIVPVLEGEKTDGVRLWVILERPDVSVKNGALIRESGDNPAETLASSGSVVMRLDDMSFLYLVSD